MTDTDQSPLPVRANLVTQPLGILASLRAARRNLLEILPEMAVKQPMVSGHTGLRWHMVMDPGAIRRILQEKLGDYPKSDTTKGILRPAIGNSMFIAEGSEWQWQRRAAAPAFSHRNLAGLGPVMSMAARNSLDRITAAGTTPVDLYAEMVRATFEVIGNVTFSGHSAFGADEVHHAIDAYIKAAGRVSLLDIPGMPDWMPRPGRILNNRALRRMRAVADCAVDTRRSAGRPDAPPDLLDLLLSGEDPTTGRRMNTAELRDNLLTFIVAGHETTALTLSWALYLCAFDQTVQARARDEARAALNGRIATVDDMENLPLCRMIIDETLRLYPPAGILSRTAKAHDTLCDREIRPGDAVIIPIYALHRHRLLWQDPDAFRPDRFVDRREIDRYSYLPFGDGPRICIGAGFAIQEAVLILATLLANRRFAPVAGKSPAPVMILTLRPDGGVWLTSEPA